MLKEGWHLSDLKRKLRNSALFEFLACKLCFEDSLFGDIRYNWKENARKDRPPGLSSYWQTWLLQVYFT